MQLENAELKLNKGIQVGISNHTWQVDHTVFDLSEESTLPSRLVLAIVADLYAQTIVGYHMAAEEPSKVAIAELLHALCQKDYPSRYGLSALWSFGDSPQFPLIDGSKEFDQTSNCLSEILGTSKIKLVKMRENSYVSKTYIERLLQDTDSNLLKQQSVSKASLQSQVKVPLKHDELKSLLEDYFFQYNRNISP